MILSTGGTNEAMAQALDAKLADSLYIAPFSNCTLRFTRTTMGMNGTGCNPFFNKVSHSPCMRAIVQRTAASNRVPVRMEMAPIDMSEQY